MNFHNDNLNRASGAHNTLLSKRGMAAKAAAFLCILAAMLVCGIAVGSNANVAQAATYTAAEVQEMYDALPTAAEVDAMDNAGQNEVYADLNTCYDAWLELTEAEQEAIGESKFDELFEYFATGVVPVVDVTINYYWNYPPNHTGGTMLTDTYNPGNTYYEFLEPTDYYIYGYDSPRTIYVFMGWGDGNDDTSSSVYAKPGDSKTIGSSTSTRSYYAIWEQVKVNISDGHGTTLSSSTMTGLTFTVPAASEAGTYSGHTFSYWNITILGYGSYQSTNSSYASGTSISISNYLGRYSSTISITAVWTTNTVTTYSITYSPGTGSGTSYTNSGYTSGTKITLPTESDSGFSKSGYYLSSWKIGSSTYNPGDTYNITGTVTATAQWTQKYRVTYSAGTYGSGSTTYSGYVKSGETVKLPTSAQFTRTGYTQKGWSTGSAGTSKTYSFGETIPVTKNVTLYPYWEANSYTWTVWKDPNNTAWTYYYFVYDSTTWTRSNNSTAMSTAQTPSWGNYTFAGWYTANYGGGTQVFTASGAKTGSYWSNSKWVHAGTGTLYAKWTYKISYNANAGSDSVSGMPSGTTTKIYGKSVNLSTATPTRTGYTFKGWSTSSSATAKSWDAGGAYSTDNNTPNSDGKVVLYAVWEANSVDVTFNLNGGKASTAIGTKTVTYGKSDNNSISTLSSSNVTKEGYTLTGWGYKSASGTTLWDAYGNYATTATSYWNSSGVWIADISDFTAYAKWRANTYTVIYDANGGAGDMDSTDATYDVEFKLAANEFYKTGYHFAGWSDSQTAKTATYTDQQTVKNLAGKLVDKDTITLYAVWEANSYTIKYDANGGTNAPASQTKSFEQDLVLRSKGNMTREGYTFVGWSTSEESTVTAYAGGGTMTKDVSITDGDEYTLFAVWVRDGANFNMTNVIDDTDMFAGDGNLRGGSGTTYSDSHIDSEYARVDGGKSSSTPGYFTGK